MKPAHSARPPASGLPDTLAATVASVADAPDRQLAQIVALLDALPARGPADALIAAARPRLATIRPRRPPSAMRSLLRPLTPLLRSGSFFNPSDPALSRPAAVAIARELVAALCPDGIRPPDLQAAAEWLASAPPPPGWAELGRAAEEYPPMRDRMRAVFALADELADAPRRLAALGIAPADEAERLLERARLISSQGELAVLALLLAIPVLAGPALALAARTPALRAGALGCALAAISPPVTAATPEAGTAPRTAAAAAASLAALAVAAPSEAAEAVRAMDLACQASLSQGGVALAELMAGAHNDAGVIRLESAARDLRCLATTAARLGTPAAYERIMTQIAGAADRLPRPDAARLAEILLGTEAALARLRAPRPATTAPPPD